MGRVDTHSLRALVCDLDGTLYEPGEEFDFFARQVRDAIPPARRGAYWAEWQLGREGRHPLRVGRVYDVQRDWAVRLEGGVAAEAFDLAASILHPWPAATWRRVPEAELRRAYPTPGAAAADGRRRLAVGDPWRLVPCLGLRHGAPLERIAAAYHETRRYMASDACRVEPVPGLRELLSRWRAQGVRLVLATDTPPETAAPFLESLGLADLFDECVFGAQKPEGLERLLDRLIGRLGGDAGSVASVGDNWTLDIEPALRRGCPAVFVDRYGVMAPGTHGGSASPPLIVVRSARDWVERMARARLHPDSGS